MLLEGSPDLLHLCCNAGSWCPYCRLKLCLHFNYCSKCGTSLQREWSTCILQHRLLVSLSSWHEHESTTVYSSRGNDRVEIDNCCRYFTIALFLPTSLCCTYVLATDVLNNPQAADLVTPWLVAYPLALLVRAMSLHTHTHTRTHTHTHTHKHTDTFWLGEFRLFLPQVPKPRQDVPPASRRSNF